MLSLKGKKVLVAGAGLSGIAAVNLLSKTECNIVLYDGNSNLKEDEIRKKLSYDIKCNIILGNLPEGIETDFSLVILSPGIPCDLPVIKRFQDAMVPVIGEIELAYQMAKGKLIAITGTNGKTTTTALVGEIMKRYFQPVFVVGNIGIPYTEMANRTTADSVTVAEISSFQLETIQYFRPDVSVILNITPDHLDRHHTMEAYTTVKEKIAVNQGDGDVCILNYEDPALHKFGSKSKLNIIWFSSSRRLEKGLFLEDGSIYYRSEVEEQRICAIDRLHILGKHNYENVMAAVGASIAMSVPIEEIRQALYDFTGVEHRIEFVAKKHGVSYYNDSKGTNPDASIQAIRAMPSNTILIAGGYDKNADYDDWIKSFGGKITHLILMGQTKNTIASSARRLGYDKIKLVDDMASAVDFARKNAAEGECVLLSPCCASWGMFSNYEERGKVFKDFVNQING